MMIPKPKPKRKSGRNPIPKELLGEVSERDDGVCQYCGVYCGNQIPHHIVPAGIGGKRIHRIENLITFLTATGKYTAVRKCGHGHMIGAGADMAM